MALDQSFMRRLLNRHRGNPPPTLRPIGRLESATLRLETGHKTFQTLLTIEQIAQTIGFGTLDQRPDKYPILAVSTADISVVPLSPQLFLQGVGTVAIAQAGYLD